MSAATAHGSPPEIAPTRWGSGPAQAGGLTRADLAGRRLARSRLEEVSVGGLATSAYYEDFDDLWFSFEQGVGRSGLVYLRLDAERRKAVRSRAQELLGAPQVRFRLDARAW
jgi:hypothetical protein